MSSIQQEQLINFLNAGKALYIESVDVATSLENSDLLGMLGVSLISQGNYTATIQHLQGAENSYVDNFSLHYAYDSELDYLVDELQLEEGSALLQSQDDVLRTAYYENEYRVISSSILLGGMKDGIEHNKKAKLMKRYLAFLEHGLQPNPQFVFESVQMNASAGYETEHLLPIKNTGLTDLVIESYQITGNSGFFLNETFPVLLPFDSTMLLLIAFSNGVTGSYQETLELQTNAGNFPISLYAENHFAPELSYSPDEFFLELSPDDEFYTANLDLQNSGEYPLDYSLQLFQLEEESYTEYDYEWEISPNYNWLELQDIGEVVQFQTEEEISEPMELENGFIFYGNQYHEIYISNKGLISFLPFSMAHSLNSTMPNQNIPLPIIAPFWDDLTNLTGEIYFYQDEEKIVVQFENRSRFSGISDGTYTFQIMLYDDATIKLQYKELQGDLESCTVGLQDESGEKGAQIVFNEPFLANEQAILLHTAPEWLSLSESNGILEPSQSTAIELDFQVADLRFGDYYSSLVFRSNDPTQLSFVIPIHLSITETSATADNVPAMKPLILMGNYPNPFNPNTKIMYELQEAADVKITIYNTRGQKIKQIEQLSKQPGTNHYLWNGTNFSGKNVSSGVYYYQLETENFSATRRMILLK